jgi:hypothetical protein
VVIPDPAGWPERHPLEGGSPVNRRSLSWLVAALLLVVAPPVLAGQAKTLDFDTAQAQVANLTQGGTVAVSSVTKVEALAGGDIVSESAFFYPASPAQIVQALSTAEGLCKLSAFCKGIQKTGPTADGKGWQGEMTVDLTRVKSPGSRDLWSPAFVARVQQAPEKEYKARFEVTTESATPDSTTVRFKLTGGRIFQRLDVECQVFKGGSAASLVVVRAWTRSSISDDVGERVYVAKRVMRMSPRMLGNALTAAGPAAGG